MNIKDLVTHWDDIQPETEININFKLIVGGCKHCLTYSMYCLDMLVSEHEIFNMNLTEKNVDYCFGINSIGAYIDIRVWG